MSLVLYEYAILYEYASPGEDTYSADFVMDTLNLAYPGCTRVYLAEAGHVIAFYRKKNVTGVGPSVEQGMEACWVLAKIPVWMGKLAKFKVRAVSLQEVNDIVNGLKRVERENSRKARQELDSKLSALKLGQVPSGLSATPFVPLVDSSAVAMGQPGGVGLPPPQRDLDLTPPLYTTDDEGTIKDVTVSCVSSKASSQKQGSHGKRKKKNRQTHASGINSDSGASSISASQGAANRRKQASMLKSLSLSLVVKQLIHMIQ